MYGVEKPSSSPSSSPASMTPDDVRVVELRDRARLAAEALELVGVPGDLAVHELDRDLALEHGVERAVDGRHPAGPDLRVEAVALGEQGADRRSHGSYCAAGRGGETSDAAMDFGQRRRSAPSRGRAARRRTSAASAIR